MNGDAGVTVTVSASAPAVGSPAVWGNVAVWGVSAEVFSSTGVFVSARAWRGRGREGGRETSGGTSVTRTSSPATRISSVTRVSPSATRMFSSGTAGFQRKRSAAREAATAAVATRPHGKRREASPAFMRRARKSARCPSGRGLSYPSSLSLTISSHFLMFLSDSV